MAREKKKFPTGLSKKGFYWFFIFLTRWAIRMVYWLKIENLDHVPKEGRLVVFGNHISLMDPILLMFIIKRPVSFMSKIELFSNKPLGWLLLRMGCIPIDRKGTQISALRAATNVLNHDRAVGIFPEGKRSKDGKLGSGLDGIGMLVQKTKSPMIPAVILTKSRKPAPFTRTIVRFGEVIDTAKFIEEGKNYADVTEEAMRQLTALIEEVK